MSDSDSPAKIDPALRQQILDLVYHPQYQPTKPKGVHQALGLPPEAFPQVRMAIKRLVQHGELAYARNHLVLTPDQISGDPKMTRGTFRQAAAGFGFVRPVTTGKLGTTEDIFIPASATLSAMDRDLVQVRVRASRKGGGQEGEVVEILERARRQFSGSYAVKDGNSVVWLDGVTIGSPVMVGDVRGLPLEQGDKVVVELVHFPDGRSVGEGVIIEVLGSSKNPAVDTLAVMRQYGLADEFPAEVIDQARATADAFVEGDIPADRRDLTGVVTLTIDPFDARDFDDAISLSKNEKGHWELLVHIADVSHFVPIGSVLDEEARDRGTSVYLPDRVIPMLPELISNHLASLQPNKVRLTKTVLMEMTEEGTVVHQEVFNSVIHNDQRLNYEQVDQYLENPERWRERLTPEIWQLLRDIHTLAMVLRQNRKDTGAIELHLPEVKIDLDKAGKVKGARITENTESHQMIEECMLAANQAVATWLDQLEIPFLRRAHAPPERRKMRKLDDFMRDLGIKCESMENRFEVQRVVELVRGKVTEYAVNYAILKSMSKAVYQPEEEMHYALQFQHYCHFTSPIRRYPDLQVHRTVDRLIRQTKPYGDPLPVLIQLGRHCSDKEQNAEWAEREIIKIKLLHFLNKKIGETMPGVISGVVPDGFYVRGIKFPAEGFVSIQDLPKDSYKFERRGQMLEGFRSGNRFRLGDELVVRIQSVDLARRALLLSVVEKRGQTVEDRPKRGGGKAQRKEPTKATRNSSSSKGAAKKRASFKGADKSKRRRR
ncbi:ribonuclease R [Aureliella helgolandensis]|uniref:Ribonuclease R n=1 Tax=Aureliella helgolandensis TaxID=2527968 RepID=A0A518GFZ3_9BACT|nr:ribonuclease R [Aureliella helgolandensis]QDV27513.1 Ribonuclease R [Aureliella helgolandensis]